MEKLQSFLSQRACGCWKQAENAVRLGPSETREENIILKGCPLSHSLLQEGSETGMRDRRNPIVRWHREFRPHASYFAWGFSYSRRGLEVELKGKLQWNESFMEMSYHQSWLICA